MCNAATKFAILLVSAACLAQSCRNADPDKDAATALLEQINICFEQDKYQEALALMDTIDQKYGSQVEIRKQIMPLRPQAIERATIQNISRADSILAETELRLREIEPKMKHISGGELEGYYVVADGYDGNFINRTGIEPRVNDDNLLFYIVAQNRGKAIGINQIAVNTDTDECRSEEIPSGSARVVSVEGSELATFIPEEVDVLGQWAYDNGAQIKGAILSGPRGNVPVKLSPKEAAAIGNAWLYANLKVKQRNARILREKLERQLQIARDHEAITN